MGLNERRKIKELQENTFPERVKEIEEMLRSRQVVSGQRTP